MYNKFKLTLIIFSLLLSISSGDNSTILFNKAEMQKIEKYRNSYIDVSFSKYFFFNSMEIMHFSHKNKELKKVLIRI